MKRLFQFILIITKSSVVQNNETEIGCVKDCQKYDKIR